MKKIFFFVFRQHKTPKNSRTNQNELYLFARMESLSVIMKGCCCSLLIVVLVDIDGFMTTGSLSLMRSQPGFGKVTHEILPV